MTSLEGTGSDSYAERHGRSELFCFLCTRSRLKGSSSTQGGNEAAHSAHTHTSHIHRHDFAGPCLPGSRELGILYWRVLKRRGRRCSIRRHTTPQLPPYARTHVCTLPGPCLPPAHFRPVNARFPNTFVVGEDHAPMHAIQPVRVPPEQRSCHGRWENGRCTCPGGL